MSRTPWVVGNWKLHRTVEESVRLARTVAQGIGEFNSRVEVGIAPVYTALHAVRGAVHDTDLRLGGQNVFEEEAGAYTGEVSAPLLKDVGCDFCIVGHSERRQLFFEEDDWIARKVASLLGHGLTPILCVGETREQRDAGRVEEVVREQVHKAMNHVAPAGRRDVCLAYEPVWAIGTGRTASIDDVVEVHGVLRRAVDNLDGAQASDGAHVRILYGGSVKPHNAEGLLSAEGVDGALVGGASLDAEAFMAIVGHAC